MTDARVYLEIFHYHLTTIRDALGRDANLILEKSDTPEDQQRSALALRPSIYLSRIKTLNRDRNFFFKVFDGHLPPASLETVIAQSRGVLVLSRNLVHSFISNEIATKKQTWGGLDTTGEFVEFDEKRFIQYCRKIIEFQSTAQKIALKQSVPIAKCTYEEISDPQEGQERVLAMADVLGIARKPDVQLEKIPNRQDTRKLATAKVSNPSELLGCLQKLGIESANDGTQAIDLAKLLDALERIPL